MAESRCAALLQAWSTRAQQAAQEQRVAAKAARHAQRLRSEAGWEQALTITWPEWDAGRASRMTPAEIERAATLTPEDWECSRIAEALASVLRHGDPVAVEAAVRSLEADPWFFGSGYAKQNVIRRLVQLDLPSDIRERLQDVVLVRIERNRGQGLRYYCRLARAVDTPALRDALHALLDNTSVDVRRRAAWVLDSLDARELTPPPGARLSPASPYWTAVYGADHDCRQS
jgi:hypothetical protein